jgi:hypothetical protein
MTTPSFDEFVYQAWDHRVGPECLMTRNRQESESHGMPGKPEPGSDRSLACRLRIA